MSAGGGTIWGREGGYQRGRSGHERTCPFMQRLHVTCDNPPQDPRPLLPLQPEQHPVHPFFPDLLANLITPLRAIVDDA